MIEGFKELRAVRGIGISLGGDSSNGGFFCGFLLAKTLKLPALRDCCHSGENDTNFSSVEENTQTKASFSVSLRVSISLL